MADKKISQLTASTTPLAGTEVLPIVQGSSTVKVSVADLTAGRAVSAASLALTSSPLPISSGGTALTSFTNYSVPYVTGAGALTSGAKLTYNGVTFQVGDGSSGAVAKVAGSTYATLSLSGSSFTQIASDSIIYMDGGAGKAVYVRADGGNVSVGFDTAGNIVPQAAAKGINFTANTPAAGMTSQLLNWYEEGTFTPTIVGSTSAGTASYTGQQGAYTRIGRVVHFQIYLVWSSGTGTGDLRIGGLPFTSGSGNNGFGCAVAMFNMDIALSANNYTVGGFVLANDTTIRLMQNVVGGGTVSNIPYDAAGEIMISGFYFA